MKRGARIVQKIAEGYKKKNEKIPLSELMILYDSHGLPPEIVRDIAAEIGAQVELPDNFYSLVADLHSESDEEEKSCRKCGKTSSLLDDEDICYTCAKERGII